MTAKLGNANFVDRAPPDVVEKTRQIEAELSGRLSELMDAKCVPEPVRYETRASPYVVQLVDLA